MGILTQDFNHSHKKYLHRSPIYCVKKHAYGMAFVNAAFRLSFLFLCAAIMVYFIFLFNKVTYFSVGLFFVELLINVLYLRGLEVFNNWMTLPYFVLLSFDIVILFLNFFFLIIALFFPSSVLVQFVEQKAQEAGYSQGIQQIVNEFRWACLLAGLIYFVCLILTCWSFSVSKTAYNYIRDVRNFKRQQSIQNPAIDFK